jgi:hypothetical protein
MIVAMQIRQLFSVVLSLSLLFSAVVPLLQATCSSGSLDMHVAANQHFAGVHSHTSVSEHGVPCASDRDTTPAEPVPCSKHAAPCCAFQAVPTDKTVTVLIEDSRTELDKLTLSCLPNTLVEVDAGAGLFRPIPPTQCSAYSYSVDKQAFLSTFLI